MEGNNLGAFSKTTLAVAKIVATPTVTSWSQAYSAGNFFAVVALKRNDAAEQSSEDDLLSPLGKEIIDSLEEEYFTLEVKDMAAIKQAITVVRGKIPANVSATFVVSSLSKDNALYVFVLGSGRVILKRGEKTGTILESSLEEADLVSASGYLEDNDVVILETKKFSEIVSNEKIISSLNNFSSSEIVESLAPLIHEKEEGEATAIIVCYKNIIKPKINPDAEEMVDQQEEMKPEKNKLLDLFSHLPFPSLRLQDLKKNLNLESLKLNHRKKIFLTIAVVIFATLLISVVSNIKKQQNDKNRAIFNDLIERAQKKYDEGQSLAVINKSLARDDFLAAFNILKEGKDKLPADSKEQKQIIGFMEKTEAAAAETSGASTVNPQQVDLNASPLLAYETKSKSRFFVQDKEYIYSVDGNGVVQFDKENKNEKKILKNDEDWQSEGGIGAYFGNIYVLDKKGQVIKFVKGDDEYSKANYLAGDIEPDFSKAVSMAIDNSVWILLKDGILKFTRGKQESFTVSGLEVSFKNPTRLLTSLDLDNLYILDNGNSRIVVLGKDGTYKAFYQADILNKAKDFEVSEEDKVIYVLSGGKIYKIDLK